MDRNCHIVPIIKYTCIFQAELNFLLLQSTGLLSLISVKAEFIQKDFLAFPATVSRVCKLIGSLS